MNKNNDHLYILWTNGDPVTSEKMVSMYAKNSMIYGWWKNVTLIIWGKPAELVSENKIIQKKIKEMQEEGVHISACRACAEDLGAEKKLQDMSIEVKYWGQPLTEVLKDGSKLLTI